MIYLRAYKVDGGTLYVHNMKHNYSHSRHSEMFPGYHPSPRRVSRKPVAVRKGRRG